jgi:peroxiredoxin/predicted 2-oxoglutarate/Fe(II)-dependent dioxygenase YbiX
MATEPSVSYVQLAPGDPAPWFYRRSTANPNFAFHTAAGRYVVLCFYASASNPTSKAAIASVLANRALFDDERMGFFGVSIDPRDEAERRVREALPGIRYFWDFDGAVSALYGAIPKDTKLPQNHRVSVRQFWLVLDPTLRVMRVFPFAANGGEQADLFAYLKQLPPPDRFAGFEVPPPILVIPNVFEPEFCQHLIGLFETHGGEESGFMRDVDGKTIQINDHSHKRRKDYRVEDPELIRRLQARISRRISPEIWKIYAFKVTRMERYIVSCYAAEDEAHFRAHRDNTTKGTAHRRFAVSINLNADFEGGEVSFPEYGSRSFKAPIGGAVIFPCALLHAVSKVTSGRRYAFLPFLYDEEAAKIRETNNQFLGDGMSNYRATG